jgi:hypothetical protein
MRVRWLPRVHVPRPKVNGTGQHLAVEVGVRKRRVGVRANSLKAFDGAVLGPSKNDEMSIRNNNSHPSFGDRIFLTDPDEHLIPQRLPRLDARAAVGTLRDLSKNRAVHRCNTVSLRRPRADTVPRCCARRASCPAGRGFFSRLNTVWRVARRMSFTSRSHDGFGLSIFRLIFIPQGLR